MSCEVAALPSQAHAYYGTWSQQSICIFWEKKELRIEKDTTFIT